MYSKSFSEFKAAQKMSQKDMTENLGETLSKSESCAKFRQFLQAKEADEEEKLFEPRLDFVLEFDKLPKKPPQELAAQYFKKTSGLPLNNGNLRQNLVDQKGDLAALLEQARLDVIGDLQKHHQQWISTIVVDKSGATILDGFH